MPELEKVTVNLTPIDVGQIELLVDQGFYANRAEFIRVAIRNELGKHEETVRETTRRQAFVLGAVTYNRRTLERLREQGETVAVRVIGFLSIADDVPPELARAVVESLHVRGVFRASEGVKAALADRTD
jgi:Arc/MetJ-type ribon-helix-helix transcriptional regulator